MTPPTLPSDFVPISKNFSVIEIQDLINKVCQDEKWCSCISNDRYLIWKLFNNQIIVFDKVYSFRISEDFIDK